MRISSLTITATLFVATVSMPIEHAIAKGGLPANGKNMTASAVKNIYTDMTWQWAAGGGYFNPDRTFIAVSGTGKNLSYAEGKWIVTASGGLCFIADWHTAKSVFRQQKTCFYHASSGGIYQSKGGSGDWYVFRSKPVKDTDEYNKLRPGNRVAELFAKAKKRLSSQ
jgi:hypothetical protein